MLDLALGRQYIRENPASSVKHFNELRKRPNRRMLKLEEDRIFLIYSLRHVFCIRPSGVTRMQLRSGLAL